MGTELKSILVREAVERVVAGETEPPCPLYWEPIGGGSINNTYRISVSGDARQPIPGQPNQWFCKVNTIADFPEMFEKEVRGLALLKTLGGMRVPQVIGQVEAGEYQVLVLEWIEEEQNARSGSAGSDLAFWTTFGESLARMHQVTDPFFGLEEDNYMGALPQPNTRSDRWTDFFTRERIEPQVRMAFDKSLLDRSHVAAFGKLYKRLPAIFPDEPASLLHGDLWSGNFLRGPGAQLLLIDPAVYFGHRSMDLAMTTLFGGFDRRFYESYQEHFPFPANYAEQWTICNLYPLLIHLNLFGRGYLGDVVESLKKFS